MILPTPRPDSRKGYYHEIEVDHDTDSDNDPFSTTRPISMFPQKTRAPKASTNTTTTTTTTNVRKPKSQTDRPDSSHLTPNGGITLKHAMYREVVDKAKFWADLRKDIAESILQKHLTIDVILTSDEKDLIAPSVTAKTTLSATRLRDMNLEKNVEAHAPHFITLANGRQFMKVDGVLHAVTDVREMGLE